MYKFVNKKRLIKRFVDMAKISSPSWQEEGIIDYLTEVFSGINVKVRKYKCDDSYNLLVKIKGDKNIKPLLFSSHMDTVHPCKNIRPVVSENRISSDGTTILGADDKSAIAIFIEAAYCLQENNIQHGPIEFLFSCAEEVGLKGVKGFDFSQTKAKYAFVFDTEGRIGKIMLKAPYHSVTDIAVKGRAAHAGIQPENGISAIRVASEIISQIPHGRIDNETTVNVGIISGGSATNIVAEECTLKLEARSLDHSKLKSIEREIERIAKTVARQNKAGVKINKELEYYGYTLNTEDALIKLTERALKRIRLKSEFAVSGGGSDTNIINRSGIKAVNLSVGMRNVHTTREYIPIVDLVNGTKFVLSIIESFKTTPQ